MDASTWAGIVLIGGFFLLMLLKVPVSFAMLLATLGSAAICGINFSDIVNQMIAGIKSFSLLAIPFFILMGEFMSAGGISEKIVAFANLCVGRFQGGLAYVNCIDSMFFGGVSGSAVADVSSLGSVVIPMMKKAGYDEDFSVGLTVCTACQGLLIPPSHNMVIYALAAGGGVTIGSLFMAGAIPGVMLGLSILIYCFCIRKKYNFPVGV
ncbi:MAG: TRAP transporter large permease subunit, partial [Clostridia bacterium]